MDKKKIYNMSLEYRISMISALSLLLLAIFLPLVSISDSGITMNVSFLNLFMKSKLDILGLVSLDKTMAILLNTARALVILYALMAILGIACYALDLPSRIKEGVIITLILVPQNIFIAIWILVLGMKAATSQYAGGAVALGIGTVIGALACIYAFFRALVYLCMYRPETIEVQTQPAAQLKGISGIYAGQVIPLEDNEKIIMGRSAEECNLIIDAAKVSRKHCEIYFDKNNGTFILKDFSLNGIYKNNGEKYAAEVQLESGASFFLGNKDQGFQVKVLNTK